MSNIAIDKKLEYAIKRHSELNKHYSLITKMAIIALKRGLKMVIENPYTQPHYLTEFWALKPRIIDKDRRQNGDAFKKPTQYWFLNFEPKQNLVFEALDYYETKNIEWMKGSGKDRQRKRSEITPQYASRFIRQYLIDEREERAWQN